MMDHQRIHVTDLLFKKIWWDTLHADKINTLKFVRATHVRTSRHQNVKTMHFEWLYLQNGAIKNLISIHSTLAMLVRCYILVLIQIWKRIPLQKSQIYVRCFGTMHSNIFFKPRNCRSPNIQLSQEHFERVFQHLAICWTMCQNNQWVVKTIPGWQRNVWRGTMPATHTTS